MNRFIILMYHMISEPKTKAEVKYACPPVVFQQHMQFLKTQGYVPVSLATAEKYLLSDELLPEKSVVITLDDGFEDNYQNAWPILAENEIPATIFLATGAIDKTNEWMIGRDFSERKMLAWRQVREMSKHGIGFGGHTVNHVNLSQQDDESALREITRSRLDVEDKLGKACRHFAYPFGLFSEQTPSLVEKAGFALACSTRSGFNNAARNPFILHRIEVYGNDPLWKLKQKLTFGMNDASRVFPLRYYARRIANKLGVQ